MRVGFCAMLAGGMMVTTSACQRDALAREQLPVISPAPAAPTTDLVTSSTAIPSTAIPTTPATTAPPTTLAPTTVPVPLEELAANDVSVIAVADPAIPVEMHLPLTNSSEFNDVLSAWAGYHRAEFYDAARAELAARQAAADAAAAELAAANEAYAQQVAAAVAASVPPPPTTPPPQPLPVQPPPSMQVTGEVFGTGSPDTGVRVHSVRALSGPPIESTIALHRLPDGAVIESLAMISPDGRGALVQAVRDEIADRGTDWRERPAADVLADVELHADGSLTVNVAPSLLVPGATAPVPVTISPDVATPVLSGFAQRILTQSTAPVPAPDCTVDSCVALTFDDGPSEFTPRLLQILADTHTKATFFMVGKSVSRHPEIAKAVADAGHEIGNHSWSHPRLGDIPDTAQKAEIDSTQTVLEQATGAAPDMLRPPYGVYNDSTRRFGLAIALWNVDTRDWAHDNSFRTITTAMQEVRPGSIILMHDIKQSSVDGVAWLMVRLRSAGYRFVTMHELFGPTEAGALYYSTDHVEPPLPPTTAPPPTPAPVPADPTSPTPAPGETATSPTAPPPTAPPPTQPPEWGTEAPAP